MNQQISFNSDFHLSPQRNAISFSCIVAGLKVQCFIAVPANQAENAFLQQVMADAFNWEDRAEQAIADDAYNSAGEIWL